VGDKRLNRVVDASQLHDHLWVIVDAHANGSVSKTGMTADNCPLALTAGDPARFDRGRPAAAHVLAFARVHHLCHVQTTPSAPKLTASAGVATAMPSMPWV
jgi:hypothetical protein